jgi:hypothetical protein
MAVIKINKLIEGFFYYFDSIFPATFDLPTTSQGEDEQTQPHGSAMYTVWNLIPDLIENQDQNENQQQQITDFYAKAATTFPRLACLMQLYFNAIKILEQVKVFVIFAEDDNHDSVINDNFVRSVETIIKKDYYKYDKTYLPSMEMNQEVVDPMIIVGKEAVIAAWKWYEHHLDITVKLFTIDPDFSGKSVIALPLVSSESKTLKQSIMLLDFNIFPSAVISCKHPITGMTFVQ